VDQTRSGSVRLRLLNDAVEEAALWELPWGAETVNCAGEKVLLEPAVTIDALRPDLERLLREGAVELYEIDDPNQVIDL
jgi:hypothetical protein